MTWEEHEGDLWDVSADALVITTNGIVRADGAAVMGRGCAKEAADRFPKLPYLLGSRLREYGNIPHLFIAGYLSEVGSPLVTLPVKHHWRGPADLALIGRMLLQLARIAERAKWEVVAMPRPGCGNGQLLWEGNSEYRGVMALVTRYLGPSTTHFIVCHK